MVFHSAPIRNLLSVERPDGIGSILRQTTCGPAQRRGHPDVAPDGAEFETSRGGGFDETRARGTSGDKRDGSAAGREGGLDVLAGIVGDVHFLPAFNAADVDLEVPGTIGG